MLVGPEFRPGVMVVESFKALDYDHGVLISIVVPAFNEERLLAGTLEQIQKAALAFTGRGWTMELIVCNNNSTDRTAAIASAAGAQVVFEPINQIARARNTGAAAATGEWLIFIDADSLPSRELFAETAELIAGGRTLAGGVTIRLDDGAPSARVVATIWNCISRWRHLLAGSFIFIETSTFRALGGFSHEWFAAEELELSQRLKQFARQSGRKLVIQHRHPLTTSARKVRLYTPWETIRMLMHAVFSGGRSLRRRESTQLWYDGRR